MTPLLFVYTLIFSTYFSFLQTEKVFQTGQATYYSKRMNGARTASGKILYSDSLVCAHRTLPFGSKVKVVNVTNGKSVVVTVIDRGPFAKGRVIDLSYAAADSINMISKGVVSVNLIMLP